VVSVDKPVAFSPRFLYKSNGDEKNCRIEGARAVAFDDRKSVMKEIEALRGGRRLLCLCNFDREEFPPNLGVNQQFAEHLKEPVYRVLKETLDPGQKVDVLLYTRGGEINAVWPIVCLLREFDSDFEVLIPFRAHSSGTLLTLGAKKLVMAPLAELSPIDPTTGNRFNPRDELTKEHLGISVEDVTAYFEFLKKTFGLDKKGDPKAEDYDLVQPHLQRLTSEVHPLAVGNVHRVLTQIKVLARLLLKKHYGEGEGVERMIDNLTTRYYSHLHMISREEARAILGPDHVEFANQDLSAKLDQLLRIYQTDFALRQPFILSRYMGDEIEKEARLIGGCVESRTWGYLYETKLKIRQFPDLPANVHVQLQPGQILPLVAGAPRRYNWEVISRSWVHNKAPIGVTV
jgi:hypothetical protein